MAHESDEVRRLLIRSARIDLVAPIGHMIEEAARVDAVRYLLQLFEPRIAQMERLSLGASGIDRLAIDLRDARRIVDALHAPLDLQAVESHGAKLRQKRQEAQVLGIHDVGAALVLLDGKDLAGTILLHESIAPAARLRTRAAVRVAPREVAAQKAAPRI